MKDLRDKIDSDGGAITDSIKQRIGALEAKNQALEQQLDNEVRYVFLIKILIYSKFFYREKRDAVRSIRLLERRLREAITSAEEADKAVINYREQVIKNIY